MCISPSDETSNHATGYNTFKAFIVILTVYVKKAYNFLASAFYSLIDWDIWVV